MKCFKVKSKSRNETVFEATQKGGGAGDKKKVVNINTLP